MVSLGNKLYYHLLLVQQDYSIIEVDDDKIIEYDIQPIHLSQPANIKNGDQVYVIQHPRGGSLAFSSSESTVNSECVHVYTVCVHVYMCACVWCVCVYLVCKCVFVCKCVCMCIRMQVCICV